MKPVVIGSSKLLSRLMAPDDLEEMMDKKLLSENLRPFLEQLDPIARGILEMYFGFGDIQGSPFEVVGKEFDVTRERVRKEICKAIDKLKNMPSFNEKFQNYEQNPRRILHPLLPHDHG